MSEKSQTFETGLNKMETPYFAPPTSGLNKMETPYSAPPTPVEIGERSTEHTHRVVFAFEDFDGEEFICSPCTEYVHDKDGRAPKRASEILCDNQDDDGRAPKRASDICCKNELNSPIHPTIKNTQDKTRKG